VIQKLKEKRIVFIINELEEISSEDNEAFE